MKSLLTAFMLIASVSSFANCTVATDNRFTLPEVIQAVFSAKGYTLVSVEKIDVCHGGGCTAQYRDTDASMNVEFGEYSHRAYGRVYQTALHLTGPNAELFYSKSKSGKRSAKSFVKDLERNLPECSL